MPKKNVSDFGFFKIEKKRFNSKITENFGHPKTSSDSPHQTLYITLKIGNFLWFLKIGESDFLLFFY